MSIVATFENQCRALTSTSSPDENVSRFLVGTLNPKPDDNLLYLFEYKDDNNILAKVSFKFPLGESWHLSSSSRHPKLVAGVLGSKERLKLNLFKLPDELDTTIEDDYGLSDSHIESVFEPISDSKNLVRQSHWHPDDGSQLVACDEGNMQFWDICEKKLVRNFALISHTEKSVNTPVEKISQTEPKLSHITDLRWSSLFNCSVVAVAIGPTIYGIDTRISDTSSASICWLVKDERCNRIRTVDFNPNSQYYIASGGDDCRANFWDLRRTTSPSLQMQPHTHWIWSIRYNPFHDQLVLTAGGDARVALLRAQSVASEPYGQIVDEEDDEDDHFEPQEDQRDIDTNYNNDKESPDNNKSLADEVISTYVEHDDAVYATEWATDPWVFATLGFESRLVINKVPKHEKFNILF